MKITAVILATMMLASCGIPSISFYDDNESLLAVEVRSAAEELNCALKQEPQVRNIQNRVNTLLYFSEAKHSDDVQEMVLPMKDTVDKFHERVKKNDSIAFCEIKKKLIVQQSKTIADAVMRRF
jgi:hypothetical protein